MEIKDVLAYYDITPQSVNRLSSGAGGGSYLVHSNKGKFVVKICKPDAINHPEREPALCSALLAVGVPTVSYVPNVKGSYSLVLPEGVVNVYRYIEGVVPRHNQMTVAQVNECAELLARINLSLDNFALPVGIGQESFANATPQRALNSYLATLRRVKQCSDADIERCIELRISLLQYVCDWRFDVSHLTYLPTHGDFTCNQIVINNKLNVIDFTCACRQPIVWELARFFFHAHPACADGKFHEAQFNEYLAHYIKHIPLNAYDIACAYTLYFYQLLVCDYYAQYLDATDEYSKKDFLTQANFASRVLCANQELIISSKGC